MKSDEILILTKEIEDTTDTIMQYLNYLNAKIKRIHREDIISDIEVAISDNKQDDKINIFSGEKKMQIDSNTKLWYRRGDFSYKFPISNQNIDEKLSKYLLEEWSLIKYYIHDYTTILGGYYKEFRNNKLENLHIARNCGMNIPHTLITNNKEKLRLFIEKHQKVITKPVHGGHLSFTTNSKIYSGKGIVFVDEEKVEKSNDMFCPSLFQNYIDKKYEIRIFFIENQLFPMAIFSQLDEKTKYDFRNYNRENPNRNVPYKLPKTIEDKILCFINKSQLKTGSIDLIHSIEDKYIFLEVNPTGQFGWVSDNCNYYLEKRIAEFLINFQK